MNVLSDGHPHRAKLLAEVCRRADELCERERPTSARKAICMAFRAAWRDPLTGNDGDERTPSMLRRCAVDTMACALLALEVLEQQMSSAPHGEGVP